MDFQHASRRPIHELVQSDAATLQQLKAEAEANLRRAKVAREWINLAIDAKYQNRVENLRQQLQKDTGVVHFEDGDVPISADRPKNVVWNQRKLAEMADRIRRGGEDPSEFIDIIYKVPERKYTAWPVYLKDAFAAARTMKFGRQIITLGEREEEA